MNLFNNERARRMIDMSIRGIEIEPIPLFLGKTERAILASNYPISYQETTRAVLKAACRLPGENPRFKAIGREGVINEAGFWLKMIGVDGIVFPAQKDETGIYKLKDKGAFRDILTHLEEPGNVIWISVTGETRGNGLLEEDLRTGAVAFSLKSQVPIVPLAMVTGEKRGKRKIVKVRFGEPIDPPRTNGLSDFERSDFLVDYSRWVMSQIAGLLPSGQRGSFENVEERLKKLKERLEAYQSRA